MKLFLGLFTAIIAMASVAHAQIGQYELSKLTVAHGRTALSSGLDVTVKFTNDSRSITLQANANRFNIAHQWGFGMVALAVTGGIHTNVPWVGPRATIDWTSRISTTHWFGWFSGAPGVTEWDPQLKHSYQSVALTVGPLEIGNALVHSLRDLPHQTPWVKYTQRLNSSFEGGPTVTWDIRNEELLYQVALTWKPTKK